jgi:hypothetical protein
MMQEQMASLNQVQDQTGRGSSRDAQASPGRTSIPEPSEAVEDSSASQSCSGPNSVVTGAYEQPASCGGVKEETVGTSTSVEEEADDERLGDIEPPATDDEKDAYKITRDLTTAQAEHFGLGWFGGEGNAAVAGVRVDKVAIHEGMRWDEDEIVLYISAKVEVRNPLTKKSRLHTVDVASCDQRSENFLVSHYGYLPRSVRAPRVTFTVGSVNIWNYNLFSERRLELLKREIQGMDLIGLQEVRSKLKVPRSRGNIPHRFQSLEMSKLRPEMEYVYRPAQMFKEQMQGPHHSVHEGLGVMSRFRITDVNALKLTRNRNDPSDFHQRLALHTTVCPDKTHLHYLVKHFASDGQAACADLSFAHLKMSA